MLEVGKKVQILRTTADGPSAAGGEAIDNAESLEEIRTPSFASCRTDGIATRGAGICPTAAAVTPCEHGLAGLLLLESL